MGRRRGGQGARRGVYRFKSGTVPGAATAAVAILFALRNGSTTTLMLGLTVIVAGFSFLQPSLNGMLSRRTDPEKQGAVLGVGQSVSALARILGPFIGIVLLEQKLEYPYMLAIVLMILGSLLIGLAGVRGRDYQAAADG